MSSLIFLVFLKQDFIYFFRERGRDGEREGEKHWCERDNVDLLPLRDPACNPGLCPDWELNQ